MGLRDLRRSNDRVFPLRKQGRFATDVILFGFQRCIAEIPSLPAAYSQIRDSTHER